MYDLGYQYVNIDTGWILSRDPSNHSLISDSTKFPSGMYNLGSWIHSKGFKYGLYSSRGTCQCGNDSRHYSAPGSYGYYQQDAQYMANMEADYYKLDSCCHVGDLQDAFDQYKQFEMYLNKTNRTMYYDLCNGWYFAVNGFDYAQSYRIANDDGSFQREVGFSKIYWIGVMSGMWKYAQLCFISINAILCILRAFIRNNQTIWMEQLGLFIRSECKFKLYHW